MRRPAPDNAATRHPRRPSRLLAPFAPALARPGRRAAAWLAGVAVLVVGATGCGGSSAPVALTVNGRTVSQAALDRELTAIVKNPQVQSQLGGAAGAALPASLKAAWANAAVEMQVAAQQVTQHHIRVIAADRTAAQTWADGYFGSAQVWAAFPKWFRDTVVARYATVSAFVRAHAKTPTAADIKADYNAALARNCASGRYVSHILVTSKAQATAVESQLAAGKDFGQLATQLSIDKQSGSHNGVLGCLDSQQIDPTFAATANATPIGHVSQPVQTQFGWHVIKVQDVHVAVPLASVENEIRTDLVEQSPDGQRALEQIVAKAKVKVAPRYGRWKVTNGQGRVEAPTPPTTTTTTAKPGAATTKPGAATTRPAPSASSAPTTSTTGQFRP